jgi:alkylmercury lyase
MKTNELQELAARITAPMRATGGRVFLEIIPPTLDLLARSKPASSEEIAAISAKSPEEVRAALDRFPSAEWDEQGRVVGLGLTLQLTPPSLGIGGPYPVCLVRAGRLTLPHTLRTVGEHRVPLPGHR